MDKKFKLPKDQFIDGTEAGGQGIAPTDQDVEGHRVPPDRGIGQPDELDADTDSFTVLPSPPSFGTSRTPGHGGE